MPSSSSRRRAGERNASLARIAELEERIHGFVEAFSNSHEEAVPANESLSRADSQLFEIPGQDNAAPYGDVLSEEEAIEVNYNIFCHRMLKYSPVVHMPSSPEVLRRERPFLLLCIRAVTSRSVTAALRLGQQIKQVIASRIVMDEDTDFDDLDLLQGLLAYIAWSHDHLLRGGRGASNVSRLTHLALTLVYEMELNKKTVSLESVAVSTRNIPERPATPRRIWPHAMEEKRTLVGCFLLSSV